MAWHQVCNKPFIWVSGGKKKKNSSPLLTLDGNKTYWSTMVPIMACCLTTPSRHLHQCWLLLRLLASIAGQFHRKCARYAGPKKSSNIGSCKDFHVSAMGQRVQVCHVSDESCCGLQSILIVFCFLFWSVIAKLMRTLEDDLRDVPPVSKSATKNPQSAGEFTGQNAIHDGKQLPASWNS